MRRKKERESKSMEEELTINVELPPVALKLRTLRLQKGCTMEVVSKVCNISTEDLCAWEMGKSEPTKEIIDRLVNFYS